MKISKGKRNINDDKWINDDLNFKLLHCVFVSFKYNTRIVSLKLKYILFEKNMLYLKRVFKLLNII